MQTKFVQAILPDEIKKLTIFDRKVFRKADWFSKEDWLLYESHWMIVDDQLAGCCAFQLNVEFEEDIRDDEENSPRPGSLYIASTGILPNFQGKGLGRLLKYWQLAYSKHYGFDRIVTNVRQSNAPMLLLNYECGFRIIRITRKYYSCPVEATIVMELKL